MFYLETSALRRVAAFFGSRVRTSRTFTSAFALFELLSGTTPTDYSERRTILCAIQSANVTVDWALPTQVTLDAFGVAGRRSDASRAVQDVCQIVRENGSYDAACEASRAMGTPWSLGSMAKARRAVVDNFLGEFASRQKAFNATFPYVQSRALYEFLHGTEPDRVPIPDEIRRDLATESTKIVLRQLTCSVALYRGSGDFMENVKMLAAGYNGSLNIHLRAWALMQEKRLAHRQSPARNDLGDVAHLLYLKNRTVKLVTDDRFLAEMMAEIAPSRVYTSQRYLNTAS